MSPGMTQDIEATNRVFENEVVLKRNVEALDRVYTANARILPPGAGMVSGRENIKAFWRSAIDSLDVATAMLQTIDFQVLGDRGIEIGQAILNFRAPGSAPAVMKYVVAWKREGGVWKWDIDIWNPNE